MSTTYIPQWVRDEVMTRAHGCCEYCLLPINALPPGFHVDHIIAEKHKGPTELQNLAFTCATCNWFKGSDIATYIVETKEIVVLYNPRSDRWEDHFQLSPSGILLPSSSTGAGTITLLNLNRSSRKLARGTLYQNKLDFLHHPL